MAEVVPEFPPATAVPITPAPALTTTQLKPEAVPLVSAQLRSAVVDVTLAAFSVVGALQTNVPAVKTNWMLARSSFRSLIVLGAEELAVFWRQGCLVQWIPIET